MPPRIASTRGSGPSRGGGTARGGGAGRGGAVAIPAHVKTVGVKRPGFGTSGRIVPTVINAFSTTIPDGIIYHYDAVNPDKLPSRLNMQLFNKLQQDIAPGIFSTPAVYDGRKNAFTMQKLPLGNTDSCTFNVTIDRTGPTPSDRPPKVYTIKMTKVAEINTEVLHRFIQGQQSPDNDVLTAITALNIVIRMDPNQRYPFNVRSFFTPEGKKDIGAGLELWRGYFQSVRPSQAKMYINLDIATGVMYKPGPLINLCLEFLNVRGAKPEMLSPRKGFPDRERIRLQRFISGMRINTEYTGSVKGFVIKRITSEAASQIMFTTREGKSISVANYFKDVLRRPLKFPDVICIEVGSAGAKIPLEFCMVPRGQIMRKQFPADKTNDMLEFSKQTPKERLTSIKTGLQVLQYGQSQYVRQFGLNVEQAPLTVQARVLAPPVLRYGPTSREPKITPAGGAWNMRDKVFFKACPEVKIWAIVVYESSSRFPLGAAQEMAAGFIEGARSVGMRISDTQPLITYANGSGNVRDDLVKAGKGCMDQKKGPPTLIVVVLPEGGNQIYTAVKHFGDVTQGVVTQCLKSQKVSRAKMQYWANVMLKVNVKLGGVNNVLHDSNLNDPRSPCIVMGADVMHPAPGADGRPSFASLVSSVDINTAKYIAINSVQAGRQEIIDDLESMVTRALDKWLGYSSFAEKGRLPPARIIFYRDGVSEGQFAHVLEQELPMIRNACKAKGVRPKITVIIVGKRHHIRMFPQNDRDGDRTGNCQAGTTIDDGLGHPTEFDYYQLTHGGLLGTSRPAHYSVIHDDSGFSADAMQNISFSLCHVYARATRSVSIPAPVYYADIACARAKNHYAPGSDFDPSDAGTVIGAQAESQLEAFKAGYKPLNPKMENSMYFM
ncbi:argonaute-like protein [Pholiota conissans]|uniref:Argonaute-like protein n=1 Tax=Pholiota conissans TaxID=109636 RepID=A0A9P5Z527_9AGAR|nr:argonaute-like protein [Pholiota conissans]